MGSKRYLPLALILLSALLSFEVNGKNVVAFGTGSITVSEFGSGSGSGSEYIGETTQTPTEEVTESAESGDESGDESGSGSGDDCAFCQSNCGQGQGGGNGGCKICKNLFLSGECPQPTKTKTTSVATTTTTTTSTTSVQAFSTATAQTSVTVVMEYDGDFDTVLSTPTRIQTFSKQLQRHVSDVTGIDNSLVEIGNVYKGSILADTTFKGVSETGEVLKNLNAQNNSEFVYITPEGDQIPLQLIKAKDSSEGPSEASDSENLSDSEKLGLAFGVGIPLVVILIVLVMYAMRRDDTGKPEGGTIIAERQLSSYV